MLKSNHQFILEYFRELIGSISAGTHILRHGMAKLARSVGGGLDAVIAITGHKDLKLANHYSKCDEDDQKHFSEKVMEHIRKTIQKDSKVQASFENVIVLEGFKNATSS